MNKKTLANQHNYVVILAGGSGTRLWPRSRNQQPKQFLKVVGEKTMIQLTAERALQLAPWERIIIVTNKNHLAMVKAQLPEVLEKNILLEPEKKDTALAMLVGALYAHQLDPQAVIINSASDHYVANIPEFTQVMTAASQLAAANDNLITVGIAPTRPETGFGYIRISEESPHTSKKTPVFLVNNFTEKPNAATAAAFIATGKYFWNANMYVWSSQALINAFQKHAPDLYQAAAPLLTTKTANFNHALTKIYPAATSISIDYAISEKAENLLLIPGNFGWSDIGDWQVAYDLNKKDSDKNVLNHEENSQPILTVHDSRGNLISAGQDRLIALLGIQDLVIVDTPEILMIAQRERSQEVKKLVEAVKKKKLDQYL